MPTINPRIAITVPQHRYDLWKRMAELQGASMASLITEVLEELYPMLERMCVVLEAAQKAQQSSKEGLRKAVEQAEAEFIPLAKSTMGQFDLFMDRVTDAVTVESALPGEKKKAAKQPKAAALAPRVVTRGSGSQRHTPEKQVKPSTGKVLKKKTSAGDTR